MREVYAREQNMPAIVVSRCENCSATFVVRGTESGGAVKDIGPYVSFCGQHGAPGSYLHPIDLPGVNGLHALPPTSFLTLATYAALRFRLALEECLMTTDRETKAEVLKFYDVLRAAAVAKVTVSYYGSGDEGRAESAQFQDSDGNPLKERHLGIGLDLQKLSDLLESFAPAGYEDNEGGFGTVTFDLETLLIRVEHNWYETVSHPDEPREI